MGRNKNNQLFKEIPPMDLVEKILKYFIPTGFDTNYKFSREDITNKKIIKKISANFDELSKYYLNCKINKYLVDLTPRKAVTLLRQILRPYNYKITAIEKYCRGDKYLLYCLQRVEISPKKEYHLTLKFD